MSPWKTNDCCPNHLISNRYYPALSPADLWPGTEACAPQLTSHPFWDPIYSCVSILKLLLQSKPPQAFDFPQVGARMLPIQQVITSRSYLSIPALRLLTQSYFQLLSTIFSMHYIFPLLLSRTLKPREKDMNKCYFQGQLTVHGIPHDYQQSLEGLEFISIPRIRIKALRHQGTLPLLTCAMTPSFDPSLSHELWIHFCHHNKIVSLHSSVFTYLPYSTMSSFPTQGQDHISVMHVIPLCRAQCLVCGKKTRISWHYCS